MWAAVVTSFTLHTSCNGLAAYMLTTCTFSYTLSSPEECNPPFLTFMKTFWHYIAMMCLLEGSAEKMGLVVQLSMLT